MERKRGNNRRVQFDHRFFKCCVCRRKFFLNSTLIDHQLNHHINTNLRVYMFTCHCNDNYLFMRDFNQHCRMYGCNSDLMRRRTFT